MEHLTDESMMHRDLAARNILVFRFDVTDPSRTLVKICDYGLARDAGRVSALQVTRHMVHVMTQVGTTTERAMRYPRAGCHLSPCRLPLES